MSRSLPDDAVLDLNESAAVASNNLDRSVVSPSAGATSAAFHGILFDQPGMSLAKEQPAAFGDLNLDQVVEGATNGREQYELKPVYYTHLTSADGIDFRQAVFRDLERPDIRAVVDAFAKAMNRMREQRQTSQKLHCARQQQWLLLDAAATYCSGLVDLQQRLGDASPASEGLRKFRRYIAELVASERFVALRATADSISESLSAIRYCMLIFGGTITVRRFADEMDYSQAVEMTFERFKRGAVKDYKAEFHNGLDMNHVQAAVLELVAKLYPELFTALEVFSRDWRDFEDATVMAFDREVQFYLGYLDYIRRLRDVELGFCYPVIADKDKAERCTDTFDLALARSLLEDHGSLAVTNDFDLAGAERILVVSGPNQGGKTTFARMLGQLHVLAGLGCPVPGTKARLYLCDELYTHFEREEDIDTLRGKLQDDLVRIHDILARATERSIIVMNEIFTSTTLSDALFLSRHIMDEIIERDLLCLCVTFLDELASLGPKTVSLVSTIAPDDPAKRTYKIIRRQADGRAHAMAIARKHGLAADQLKERLTK